MEVFELPKESYTLWDRVRKELALLLLLIAILLFFVGLQVVYFTAVIVMYSLLLMLKRNRIVTSLSFNDQEQEIRIAYYYFIFLKGSEKIPYAKLNSKLSMKRFGFGAATQTIEIFKGRILSAEIRKDGKWSWPEAEMDQISERLSNINREQ
ncbi:hypothetical protein [Marinifilum caeruleilacunae]|uniref:DUF304 domain-containing protein n=1 Tax=Marinifilum caeruleilacunae TaxID=2499076 RepID=A0ABX1WW21_9BACT|nr:hypothetical protein [Marinifilum caeruleilacunae]NOU60294.1 hypothetical protein [Marinifilum caeruleilacunae]